MAGGRASARKLYLAQRREKAVEWRVKGLDYRAIAEKMVEEWAPYDYTKAQRDCVAAIMAIADRANESARMALPLELMRLDAMLAELWDKRADPRVADSILRISERRAKLLGLDAPTRTDITSDGTRLVIEYVNDWRGAPAITAPWTDSSAAVSEAAELVECRPALAQEHPSNGNSH